MFKFELQKKRFGSLIIKPYIAFVIVFHTLFIKGNTMSMTKDLFFDALADAMQPTDAEIEMQYWYELKERREMYLAFVTKQVEEMPDNHFFSPDFEAWMQQQKAERSKDLAELLMARRKASTPTTDMDFDIPMDVEDSNHQKRNQELDNLFI